MMLPAEITVLILVLFLIFRWLYGLLSESKFEQRIKNVETDFADLWEKYRKMEGRVTALDNDTDDMDWRLDQAGIVQAPAPGQRRQHRPIEPTDWTPPSQRRPKQ